MCLNNPVTGCVQGLKVGSYSSFLFLYLNIVLVEIKSHARARPDSHGTSAYTQSAFLSLGCWDWPATVVTSLPLVSQCTSGRSRRKHCSSRSSDANLFIGKQKQIWFETPDDHQSHTIVMVSRTLSASRSDDKCCKCQNKSHFKASDANVRLTTTD